MARLLHEIDWSKPVLSMHEDPAWAAEVKHAMGAAMPNMAILARSPWVRRTVLQFVQARPMYISARLSGLCALVTAQENSCRFCYGGARAGLKILGLQDHEIDQIEREARMAGADESERAILQFCRNLSRSTPRPARSAFEALVARGLDPMAVVEIAVMVAASCFNNRVATFVALPIDPGTETMSPGLMSRLMMRLMGMRYPRRLELPPAAPGDRPFSQVVALGQDTEGAAVLAEALRAGFASTVLPARTKAWVFAVVARALGCHMCEAGAARLLEGEGIGAPARERVLSSLAGPELDATEAILLPWVRETAHYQTEVMQRKTHELRQQVNEEITLEAIGLAALANACARLGMLAQDESAAQDHGAAGGRRQAS